MRLLIRKPRVTTYMVLTAFIAVTLASCTSNKDPYQLPSITLPKTMGTKNATNNNTAATAPTTSNTNTPAPTQPPLSTTLSHWWQYSSNSELNDLIDRALANNRDLRIATWQIAQAQAKTKRAIGSKMPTITMPFSAGYQGPYTGVGRNTSGTDPVGYNLFQLSMQATWRADIWGELDALQQSTELQLWRSTFQRDDIQRLMVSQLATDYIEYLTLNDRLRVAKETEATLKDTIRSVTIRLEKGDATITELEQQRTAMYSISATIPSIQQQRQAVSNKITESVGALPGTLKLSDAGIESFDLTTEIPSVPSELLLRRPDVRAIEARLLAANADIEVARARLLPPIDLSAQVGYGSQYMANMFQPSNLFWNLLGNITATLFDGGQKNADVELAQAVHEEMIETYLKVIYNAIKEIDTAMSSVNQTDKTLEHQRFAAESSRMAWQYSKEAYMAGAVDFLTLLDTQRTYYKNLDELYRVQMDKYKSMVSFYSALGGGLADQTPLTRQQSKTIRQDIVSPKNLISLEKAVPTIEAGGEHWYVELTGIYSRTSMMSAVRDFNKRRPEDAKKYTILPYLQGKVEDKAGERASWYRLFVNQFANETEAKQYCDKLSLQQRCSAISASVLASRNDSSTLASSNNHQPKTNVATAESGTAPAAHIDGSTDSVVDKKPALTSAETTTPRLSATTDIKPTESTGTESVKADVTKRDSVQTTSAAPVTDNAPIVGYTIQLGSFQQQDEFEKSLGFWQNKGYQVYGKQSASASANKTWQVIRMDQVWSTRAEAQKLATSITQKDGIPVIVLPVREDTPSASVNTASAPATQSIKSAADIPAIPDLFVPSILQKKAPKPFSEIPILPSTTAPVAKTVETTATIIATAPNTNATYAVIVTTVATENKANQWLGLLQKQGIDARIITPSASQKSFTIQLNQEWIREADAIKMADKISQSYAITPQVVMQQLYY